MRVLVCGGRNFADRDAVWRELNDLHRTRGVTVVIEGGATGADRFAAQWAETRKVTLRTFAPDWKNEGRAAGPRRNAKMLAEGRPEMVLAFPGGRGTADMVRRAKAARIDVLEVRADPGPRDDADKPYLPVNRFLRSHGV